MTEHSCYKKMMEYVQRCRSCKAQVVWLEKPKRLVKPGDRTSRTMINATPEAIRRAALDLEWEPKHVDLLSHFATCPEAKKWRKSKAAKKKAK